MKTRRLSFLFLFLAGVAAAAGGCRNVPALQVEDTYTWPDDEDWVRPETRKEPVDLLFVIDDSPGMADGQIRLARALPALVERLGAHAAGLPDLHVGVISTDLGTAPYNSGGCEVPGGDGGRLLKGRADACANPVGQRFVVDVAPRGCTVQKNIMAGQTTTCPSHDCTQAHCDAAAFTGLDGTAAEPAGLTFVEDGHGCPRCRNYANETLAEVLSCTTDLGTTGCGMEQPLEALWLALTAPARLDGFWRPEALLFVVFLTNEDDCSVKVTELFNPQGDVDTTLGPLTSFRCTEFGVACDQPWDRVMPDGPVAYTGCVPREANDPKNLLHPISRYVNLLAQTKDPTRIFLAAIAGPSDGTLTVDTGDDDHPALMASCGNQGDEAVPAVRLRALVEAFPAGHPDSGLPSYCAPDYTPALIGLAGILADRFDAVCLSGPIVDCPDPAAAAGEPPLTALPPEVAARCEPRCQVWDEDADHEIIGILPCPADHAGGHPPGIDPALPMPACWHITYSPACAAACPAVGAWGCDPAVNPWWTPSRGAGLRISRKEPAAPGVTSFARCPRLPLYEVLCANGLDDDVDGRTDGADPDCLRPAGGEG